MDTHEILQNYRLISNLSENNLTRSWIAKDEYSGEYAFLKVLNTDSGFNQDKARDVLQRACNLQKNLTSRLILKPQKFTKFDNAVAVEYPYLSADDWKPLSYNELKSRPIILLKEIALVLDYLHLMGMVHGDIKFSNIFYNSQRNSIKLADLDFVSLTGQPLSAKLFGTPGFIAPELLNNEPISIYSDNYSLGVNLQEMLTRTSIKKENPDLAKKLYGLSENLTAEYPYDRPPELINALYDHEIIDKSEKQRLLKRLFTQYFINKIRNYNRSINNLSGFKSFIMNECRIQGIHFEILEGIYDSTDELTNPNVWNILRFLIKNVSFDTIGEFWHIRLDDDDIKFLFDTWLSPQEKMYYKPAATADLSRSLNQINLDNIEQSIESGQVYKNYFLLKEFLKQAEKDPDVANNIIASIKLYLGRCTQYLNRLNEASNYYEEALKLTEEGTDLHKKIAARLGWIYLIFDEKGKIADLCDTIIDQAKKNNDIKTEVSISRIKAYQMASHGRHDESLALLNHIIGLAKSHSIDSELSRALNIKGVLYWNAGDFKSAEKYLLESIELLDSDDPEMDIISPYTNIALIIFEMGRIHDSIKYSKKAISNLRAPSDNARLTNTYYNLVSSFIRTCDFNKARYWLNRLLSEVQSINTINFMARFYLISGYLELYTGNIAKAEEKLNYSLNCFSGESRNRILGKVYSNLAEVSIYKGNYSNCLSYCAKAEGLFNDINDNASLAEVKFIITLNEIYNKDGDPARLEKVFNQLVKYNCLIFSAFCYLYMTLNSRIDEETKSKFRSIIPSSDIPLIESIKALEMPADDDSGKLNRLKEAYTILHRNEYMFPSFHLCKKIAEEYSRLNQPKLAKKFYLQSKKLAERLRNGPLKNEIKEIIDSIPEHREDENRYDSLYRLSEIISKIDDHDEALNQLLNFTLVASGAERCALLLRQRESDDLAVKAYLNCDRDELPDIIDISKNIPLNILARIEPEIISNALDDDRTKNNRSVLKHNIQSVICAPLIIENEPVGVLYLDHHTIPGLFDTNDLKMVKSIANFVSVMMSTLKYYRNLKNTSKQYLSDLERHGIKNIPITKDPSMLELIDKLKMMAKSNTPILIRGESGTGKEIFCHLIHEMSLRKNAPLIKMNCTEFAENILESELFGIKKGVATGVEARDGLLAAADGGTLFMDEIGDMPLNLQAKLLRVVEYQEYRKVGSNLTSHADIRFIYATNKNIKELINQGKFREDLFFRINSLTINIPPLRERSDDIPILIDHFVNQFLKGRPGIKFSSRAIDAMQNYVWPGNVRELKNLVEKYCILYPGKKIEYENLPSELLENIRAEFSNKYLKEDKEKKEIRRVLLKCHGNQSMAARELDMPLSTLRYKIKKYQINTNP